MPEDPNEDLLHEVLRPLRVGDGAVDKVDQGSMVAVHQRAERLGITLQVLLSQAPVVELIPYPKDSGECRVVRRSIAPECSKRTSVSGMKDDLATVGEARDPDVRRTS